MFDIRNQVHDVTFSPLADGNLGVTFYTEASQIELVFTPEGAMEYGIQIALSGSFLHFGIQPSQKNIDDPAFIQREMENLIQAIGPLRRENFIGF